MEELTFPFVPPWEDCRLAVEAGGARAYVFDTCCKAVPAAEAARRGAEVVRWYGDCVYNQTVREDAP